MTRTGTAIAVLAVLGLAALPSLHIEPIERVRRTAQQTDMRAMLDALPLPAESRLLAIAEAPYPATTYFFASPWNGQYLCDELLKTIRTVGDAKPWEPSLIDRCGFSAQVVAGWRAFLVGVFTYEVRGFALHESRPGLGLTEEICEGERADRPRLESRLAPCWLDADESYFYVTIFGEKGWIESELPKDAV